jgi:hypothetical protein
MSPLSPSPEIPLPLVTIFGERDFNPAPLLLIWEKGLGDEGRFAKMTCSLFQLLSFVSQAKGFTLFQGRLISISSVFLRFYLTHLFFWYNDQKWTKSDFVPLAL